MSAQPLARAFRQIGGMTAVSRVLGFVRDVVFAALLGAGPAADAFLVALKLPNMFRRLTAEGALSNAFVPAFARARREDGEAAAMALAGETQTTLTMVLVALVILGEIFMPAVIGLLAPGFSDTPDRMNAAITLARVTFPYLPMISLVAFWAAIANADGRFMTAAAMPVIFNILLVGGADLLAADLALHVAGYRRDGLVQHVLADVVQHHIEPGEGHDMRDAVAHLARADHADFPDLHWPILPVHTVTIGPCRCGLQGPLIAKIHCELAH